MKYLDGNISVHRSSDRYIHIVIEDGSSRIQIINASVPMESFAKAVTGLSYQPCTIEYNDPESIGKTREHKIGFVPFRDDAPYDRWSLRSYELCKPIEVDGWHVSSNDKKNYNYKRHNNGQYEVHLVRYV